MCNIDIDEMTFTEILTAGQNYAANISLMLNGCDPEVAASVLLQLAEIDEWLAGVAYSDFLAMAEEYEPA